MNVKIQRAIKTTTGYFIDLKIYDLHFPDLSDVEVSIETDLDFKIERMFRISSNGNVIPSLEEIEEIIKQQRVKILFKSNEFLIKLTKENFTFLYNQYFKLNEQGNALESLEKSEIEAITRGYERYTNEERKRIAETRKVIEKQLKEEGFDNPFKNEVFS